MCVIKRGDPSFARLSILSYQLTLATQHRRDEPICGRVKRGVEHTQNKTHGGINSFSVLYQKKGTKAAAQTTKLDPSAFPMIDSPLVLLFLYSTPVLQASNGK